MIEDTIVALAGAAKTAVAIIRLSGPEARAIAEKILKYSIAQQPSHTIIHNYVIEAETVIDEVLVSYFAAPKSYTGEDLVEINIHGSSYLAYKIITLLVDNGARLAQPGEFTQRAYLNEKLDLTQAEAINDLVLANNAFSAAKASAGLSGAISAEVNDLATALQALLANIEVNIDYPEYDDVVDLSHKVIEPQLLNWQRKAELLIEQSENSLLIKEGILTVIIGEPNVGKSSLLNALLREDRALVSAVAGTTRDYIEGEVILDNLHLRLIDTAGLRQGGDSLEQLGMEKTQDLIKKAQLVILVLDASKQRSQQEQHLIKALADKEHLIVFNKSDLITVTTEGIYISALKGDIGALLNELKQRYDSKALLEVTTLHSQRQLTLMKQASYAIASALAALQQDLELELVAIDLHEAYRCLSDILGKYNRMDFLASIFDNFCLGK